MQLFIVLLCTITLLFSTENMSHKVSDKLIVSSSKVNKVSAEDLLKLKVYFIENLRLGVLQEKYDLKTVIQTLDSYQVVVIEPIDSLSLRNELLVHLSPLFKDIFYISYKREVKSIKTSKELVPNLDDFNQPKKDKLFLEYNVGLEWLALWILSAIGLFLSIRSRRKVAVLNKRQEKLKEKQKSIETEIKKLGE